MNEKKILPKSKPSYQHFVMKTSVDTYLGIVSINYKLENYIPFSLNMITYYEW